MKQEQILYCPDLVNDEACISATCQNILSQHREEYGLSLGYAEPGFEFDISAMVPPLIPTDITQTKFNN